MATARQFPHSYVNTPVLRALEDLHAAPSEEKLTVLLDAALTGGLVVDITGSTKDTGPQARTLISSDGHGVLPLFTSMKALEDAVAASAPDTLVQATVLPARDALNLVTVDELAAVQFDPGPRALVVARSHIEAALGGHSA